VVYPPTGSTAYGRETSTPPTLLLEYGPHLPLSNRDTSDVCQLPLKIIAVTSDLLTVVTLCAADARSVSDS